MSEECKHRIVEGDEWRRPHCADCNEDVDDIIAALQAELATTKERLAEAQVEAVGYAHNWQAMLAIAEQAQEAGLHLHQLEAALDAALAPYVGDQ